MFFRETYQKWVDIFEFNERMITILKEYNKNTYSHCVFHHPTKHYLLPLRS